MERQHFLALLGAGCVGLMVGACTNVRTITAIMSGKTIELSVHDFETVKNGTMTYEPVVLVRHADLRYYICVARLSATQYTAVAMRCTHQGASLQLSGDVLHCPAHGSEFSVSGVVQQGPAKTDIEQFPVTLDHPTIRIRLA